MVSPSTPSFFSESEHGILKSVCTAMVGAPCAAESVAAIDVFVAGLPQTLQRQLRFGVHLFQWAPLFFIGKPRRFTQLNPADKVRYIESWARSRFKERRRLFRGLRDIAFLGHYRYREPDAS